MKMAPVCQSPVAFASARRQGLARSARRLTPPLTATAAPAQSAVSSCLTQLLRSSTPTDSGANFLINSIILNQRLFNPSVHAFGATSVDTPKSAKVCA
jgi:N-methylhydantoinase B/oxoprolinase/acetone carboxylase alpha subunit